MTEVAESTRKRYGVLNREYGACRCWICRGVTPTKQERDWMRETLAREVLRKSPNDQLLWLADYQARHGKIITDGLRASMYEQLVLSVPRQTPRVRKQGK